MTAHARLEVVATDAGERVLLARSGPGPAQTDIVAHIVPTDFRGSAPEMEAAARRLAACWNVCIGIPDPALEACTGQRDPIARLDALIRTAGHRDGGRTPASPVRPSIWHG